MDFETYFRDKYQHTAYLGNMPVVFSKADLEAAFNAGVNISPSGNGGVITPHEMPFVSKRWGYEVWIVNNERYCGKKLFIRAGQYLSYHHHDVKDEVLYVDSGNMEMIYETHGGPVGIKMSPGFAFRVKPGIRHQMVAITDVVLFEFSTQHFDSDSIRTTTDKVGVPIVLEDAFHHKTIWPPGKR